jgi:hypothetical protein
MSLDSAAMGELHKCKHKYKLATNLWVRAEDNNLGEHYLALIFKYRDLGRRIEKELLNVNQDR